MRPRISQQEAAYLVQVLKVQIEALKQHCLELEQLERDFYEILDKLKHEVYRVYDKDFNCLGTEIRGPQETISLVKLIKALREEHPHITLEKIGAWGSYQHHERLLKKYSAIANGEPHDGRYKRLSLSYWKAPDQDRQEEIFSHLAEVIA